MKQIIDLVEFYEEVGMITIRSYEGMGIQPDLAWGTFFPKRTEELLKFCSDNPDYHIVSFLKDNIYWNGYLSEAMYYYLAEGNPERGIFYVATSTYSEGLKALEKTLATYAPALKRRMFG